MKGAGKGRTARIRGRKRRNEAAAEEALRALVDYEEPVMAARAPPALPVNAKAALRARIAAAEDELEELKRLAEGRPNTSLAGMARTLRVAAYPYYGGAKRLTRRNRKATRRH
jgi:hypothetical protein